MAEYTWFTGPVPEDLPVRQVYAVVFDGDGKTLLRIDGGRYKLSGGRPESGETYEETLTREYLEELNTELTDIHYLGYLLVEDGAARFAQVRMIAKIVRIGESRVDPSSGKVYGRELVPADRLKEYVAYPDEAGNRMLEEALKTARGLKWNGV